MVQAPEAAAAVGGALHGEGQEPPTVPWPAVERGSHGGSPWGIRGIHVGFMFTILLIHGLCMVNIW